MLFAVAKLLVLSDTEYISLRMSDRRRKS